MPPTPHAIGDRPFRAVWLAQGISSAGTQLSLIALPLVAIGAVGAGPFEIGALAAAETAPYLLVSLPAGVLADRFDRRALMILADVARAIALATVPLALLFHLLTLPYLLVVAAVVGACSVLFTVAQQSYLPEIIGTDQLVPANQRVEIVESAARVVGPSLGGPLVGLIGAAIAVFVDGLSYVGSALTLLLGGRASKAAVPMHPSGPRSSMRRELLAGIVIVWRDRALRDLVLSTALFNLASGIVLAQVVLFSTHDLGLDPGSFGLIYGLANVGFLIGAFSVDSLERRVGAGGLLVGSAVLGALAIGSVAGAGVGLGALGLLVGRFVGAFAAPLFNVTVISVRQTRTDGQFQGRVAATFRLIDWGTAPLGAVASGVIGNAAGLTVAMAVATVVGLVSAAVLLVGPVRGLALHAQGVDGERLVPAGLALSAHEGE